MQGSSIETSVEYAAGFRGEWVSATSTPTPTPSIESPPALAPSIEPPPVLAASSESPPRQAPPRESLRPGVLVLHGGSGITDHERERARQLAERGYMALIPDLFGERFRSREHGLSIILPLVENPELLRGRVGAAHDWLCAQPGVDASRTAALGFCFGGLAALELARSGARVAAVASFHGGLATRRRARPGDIRAQILVCTGADDPHVGREQRTAFEAEMTEAGAAWQLHVYGGARHAFSERHVDPAQSPGCAYHERADQCSRAALAELLCSTFRT
jgi:dienelactone hydrolase